MKIYWRQIEMTFYEDERHITFTCSNRADAEEFLFPLLRRVCSPLFVVNHRTDDFGWLSVKIKRKMSLKQVLMT